MAKFNSSNKTLNRTTNYAGGESFTQSPKLELVSILLTSFVEDQYYRTSDETLARLDEVYNQVADKKFPAKAALYARNEFGMRSISHYMAARIAATVKGEKWTKNFFDKIVYRPDDMTEIMSLVGKPVPNAVKKGFAKAFDKFDGYQLAKYKASRKGVSLVDVVNLVHPEPNEYIDALVKGELKSKNTWEAKLSKAGKSEDVEKQKAKAWADLLKENRLGYFALLRNLRNISEQSPEVLDLALEQLVDPKRIRKSKVLPFRYLTAIEQFSKYGDRNARKIMVAIDKALNVAVENAPKYDGETLVALDISGSMGGKDMKIGGLFAAILGKSNNADIMRFDNDAEYFDFNPLDSVSTIANQVAMARGGTNFHAIFETANKKYDRIIILSDMQGWIGYDAPTTTFAKYKKRFDADPRVYSIDLRGYGTMQFPERNVYALAGFSEKILDLMEVLEQDRDALIKAIEEIKI